MSKKRRKFGLGDKVYIKRWGEVCHDSPNLGLRTKKLSLTSNEETIGKNGTTVRTKTINQL